MASGDGCAIAKYTPMFAYRLFINLPLRSFRYTPLVGSNILAHNHALPTTPFPSFVVGDLLPVDGLEVVCPPHPTLVNGCQILVGSSWDTCVSGHLGRPAGRVVYRKGTLGWPAGWLAGEVIWTQVSPTA
jgi:hypothetical protein